MTTTRKHPSLYPESYQKLLVRVLNGQPAQLRFPTAQKAQLARQAFYAYRQSLRDHPNFLPELTVAAKQLRLRIVATVLFLETQNDHTKVPKLD